MASSRIGGPVLAALLVGTLTACGLGGPSFPTSKVEGRCGIRIKDADRAIGLHQNDGGFHGDNDIYVESVPSADVTVSHRLVTLPAAVACEEMDWTLGAVDTPHRCGITFAKASIKQVADADNRCYLVDQAGGHTAVVISGANCFPDECSYKFLAARAAGAKGR